MTTTPTWPLGKPIIGATAEMTREVSENDIDLFTMISGDRDKPIATLKCSVTHDDGIVALEGTAVCRTMPMPMWGS